MATLWQSLRYTLRVLAKNLGFTTAAVLSLALGIGANTAIFTLINALLLRDLPVRQPQRLVYLSAVRQGSKITFSYPMFRELERGQRVFSGMIGWGGNWMPNVEVNGVLSQDRVLSVTANCYSELGASSLLGRLLNPEDENLSGGANSQVAVIGYEFWQRRFGSARDVVGKQIRVEGHPFTIIGVTRKWFTGLTTGEPPDITVPLAAMPLIQSGAFDLESRSLLWLHPIGRLKDGITIEQARAQLQSFWPDVLLATASTQTPGLRRQTFLSMGLDVSSAAKGIAGDLRAQFARPLYVLAGIVGLILLVACVNLANLMLARAAARSHEMSVRVAIGATRWSLVRQVLSESLTLSLTGALFGLALAFWGSRLLVLLMTEGNLVPVSLNLRPDLRVLSLTVFVAILTGILFGLAPAWRSSREDPMSVLQQNARSLSGGAGRLSKALIVTQVALSLILLLGAGLFVRTFQRLRSVDLGFNQSRLLEVRLNPRPGGYDNLDMASYHKQLTQRIACVPGVISVGFSHASIPSPEALVKTISHEIASLGHEYAIDTRTIQQTTSQVLTEERVTAMLSAFFAALALLLASIGLYGLMSYTVTRRTREIGIRVAVGAQRQNVLWLVLRETLALALLGIAVGIPSALAAARLIATMLFGLSTSDLPNITAVCLLLLLVALFAGYLPARRASSIDAIVALRAE